MAALVETSLPSASVLTASAAVLLAVLIWRKNGNSANTKGMKLPPGLPSLPVVGSLPFMTSLSNMPMFMIEKAKKYGQVYTLYAAGKYTLVINGYDALKESLVKRAVDYAGRSQSYTEQQVINKKCEGSTITPIWTVGRKRSNTFRIIYKDYGDVFKENYNHSITIMKQFGFGDRHIMAERIESELSKLVEVMKAEGGKPMEVEKILHKATINIIHGLVFGKSFSFNDPVSDFLTDVNIQMVDSYDPLLDIFPVCASIPPWKNMIQNMIEPASRLMQYYTDTIRAALSEKNEDGANFITVFKELSGDKYSEDELKYILRDLVMAGSETTGIQLAWMILYLCNYPDVQKKILDEVMATAGLDRPVTLTDKSMMPYTEATMFEIMRIRPVAPLGAAHKTTCNTQLNGYDIPADTTVVINLWSALHDPQVWSEPDKFRPERFLNEKREVVNQDLLITFSLGKRSCPGQILARQELFLALATFVQKFKILPPEGMDKLSDEAKIVRCTRPLHSFHVRMVPRD